MSLNVVTDEEPKLELRNEPFLKFLLQLPPTVP